MLEILAGLVGVMLLAFSFVLGRWTKKVCKPVKSTRNTWTEQVARQAPRSPVPDIRRG